MSTHHQVTTAPSVGTGWRPGGRVLGTGAVLIGGLLVGVATSYLQGILPGASNTLANSGAVWSIAAFLLVVVTAQTGWTARMAGVTALLGMVIGYYLIASVLRGFAFTITELTVWSAAAIMVGPFIGTAAAGWTSGVPTNRLNVVMFICGLVIGEGLHGVIRIAGAGPQWWIELGLGTGGGLVAIVRYGRSARTRVVGVILMTLTAGSLFLAYGGDVFRIF